MEANNEYKQSEYESAKNTKCAIETEGSDRECRVGCIDIATKKKIALITGISGQDGSYLAEFLLEKGYVVHGMVRRSSSPGFQRIDHLLNDPEIYNKTLFLHYGDLTDTSNIHRLVQEIRPNEIYNLGAQSHVQVSFELSEYSANVNALGVLRLLNAILETDKSIKLYQASTSEMFGQVVETPQTEKTPFYPRSPYAVSKLYAYWITKNYREAYDIFTANGILFNHESERRGEMFVTRKITKGIAGILEGKQKSIELGNLDAKRDWGHAQDYIKAMWLMLQQDTPDDYVVATGKNYSVREFCEIAFKEVGIDLVWKGKGLEETGINKETGEVVITINPKYFRPTEVNTLLGDSSKAHRELKWKPKISFKQLVKRMIKADVYE